jgi:hypothetical protein
LIHTFGVTARSPGARSALPVLLALATGCSDFLGIPDPARGDGSPADAGPDGGAGATDGPVEITTADTFHLTDGQTRKVPRHLELEARWLGPDGFSDPIPAVPVDGEPGRYLLHDIPPGAEYYVRLPIYVGYYVATHSRFLDLGNDSWEQPDPLPASPGTSLVFHIDGMTPWQLSDQLEAVERQNGWNGSIVGGEPAIDDTRLSGFTVKWDGNPLIRASTGNSLNLLHQSSREVGNESVQTVVEQYVPDSPIEQEDGVATVLSGRFQPLEKLSTTINWPVPDWTEALESSVPPTTFWLSMLSVTPQQQPFRTNLLLLGSFFGEAVDLGRIEFGNPYGLERAPIREIDVSSLVHYQIPGAEPGSGHLVVIEESKLLPEEPDIQFAPMAPVTEVRVNDMPLSLVPPEVSASVAADEPVSLTWRTSLFGPEPTSYELTLLVLYRDGNGVTAVEPVLLGISSARSFTVPPGVLERNRHYALVVSAFYSPAASEFRPFRTNLTAPTSRADFASGIFSTH